LPNKVNIGLDGIQRDSDKDVQISRNIAEIFKTPTGKEVLRYLRSVTIEMVNGPNVTTEELRHIEGQRYIVGLIEQRIAHSHRSKNK
jgi:pSer/pThr/pTyr-binding forkhead associated (FHA) protein